MKINLVKVVGGAEFAATALVPVTDEDRELLGKIGAGEIVTVELRRMRNYQFFRKWWALVNFAFDYWEPPNLPDDPDRTWLRKVAPQKSKDRFRKDLTILAGYYDAHYRLDGSVRIEAKSISFGSMTEDEFEKLYSATIDVVLKHVLTNYTEPELQYVVDEALRFAA